MKKKGVMLNCIAFIALLFANVGAGTCCYGLYHQPKFPKKLNKYRV